MKTYSVSCKEEGRGRATRVRFSTLAEASRYIQDRWQGVEYKDGSDAFHTDYAVYQLHGFTFADIGKTVFDDPSDVYSRRFVFNPVADCKYVRKCSDDCDANHCPSCGGHKLDWYSEGMCSLCELQTDDADPCAFEDTSRGY